MIGILFAILVLVIAAAIGGLIIMLATKIVFKQTIEFGSAFKVALISFLVSAVLNFLIAMAMGEDLAIVSQLLSMVVGFVVMTLVYDREVGVGLPKAALVALIVYAIYLALSVLMGLLIAGIAIGAGAMQGGAANLMLP